VIDQAGCVSLRRSSSRRRRTAERGRRSRAERAVVIDADGVAGAGIAVTWDEVARVTLVVRHRFGIPRPAPGWAFIVEPVALVAPVEPIEAGAAGMACEAGAASEVRPLVVAADCTEALLAGSWRLVGFDHASARAALDSGRTSLTTLYRRPPGQGSERSPTASPDVAPILSSDPSSKVFQRRWGRGLTW
jgi:hypothetical protein